MEMYYDVTNAQRRREPHALCRSLRSYLLAHRLRNLCFQSANRLGGV